MFQTNLAMIIRQPGQAVSIIEIHGEITKFAEHVLMDTFNVAGQLPAQVLVLDFTGLEYMNSSGIGLLVSMLVKTNRRRQRLLAARLNEYYRQIFEMTHLNEAIPVFESVEAALAEANQIRVP